MNDLIKGTEISRNKDNIPLKPQGIKIGSIVSTHAHPYNESLNDVVIAAYSYFTPPLMVITEIKRGTGFDPDTGIKDDHSYNCYYYSGKDGKFILRWFKGRELKLIKEFDDSKIVVDGKSLSELMEAFLGRTAILKTVDLELGKVKTWTAISDDVEKWKGSSLLDCLPPLGTIIGIRKSEGQTSYSKKTGEAVHEKPKWLFKLRWFNNASGSFSEDEIPVDALRDIDNETIQPKIYIKSDIYWYEMEEPLSFENNNIQIHSIPISFKRAIWKHYHYLYHFKSVVTDDEFILNLNESNKISNVLDQEFNAWYQSNKYETNAREFFVSDSDTLIGRWFEIHYRDKTNRKSRRIIIVRDSEIQLERSGARTAIINANCLLRQGKIRHFYSDRIDFYREVPDFVLTLMGEKRE